MSLQETTGSLFIPGSTEKELFYYIDFTKMTKVEDLVLVLQSLGFGISNKHPHIEELKQFLNLDNPVTLS